MPHLLYHNEIADGVWRPLAANSGRGAIAMVLESCQATPIIPHPKIEKKDFAIRKQAAADKKWIFWKKSWQEAAGSDILGNASETGGPERTRSTRKKHRKRWKKELTRRGSCDRIASALARAGGGPWKPNSVTSEVKEKVSRNERSFAAELEQGLSNPKNSNEDNRLKSLWKELLIESLILAQDERWRHA